MAVWRGWPPAESVPLAKSPIGLTKEQAAAVHERLWRTAGYLGRLRERMTQVGFLMTDPMYQAVLNAAHAMQGLCVHLHYASCEGGTGQPRDRTE
jgi:hypothetical protein